MLKNLNYSRFIKHVAIHLDIIDFVASITILNSGRGFRGKRCNFENVTYLLKAPGISETNKIIN